MRKKSFKLFILGLAVVILMVFLSRANARGETHQYFGGDALYYKDDVYLVAINSGVANLYKIENRKITKTAVVRTIAENSICHGFIDGVLNIEKQGLTLFLIDGKFVYKYDINDPDNPKLIKRANDNSASDFLGLGKMDNKVYSVARDGVKIWDDDLQTFYNNSLINAIPHNFKFSKKGGFIFNIDSDTLKIYDVYSQKLLSTINLEVNDNHERNIINDETNGTIYLVDDGAVKQLDFSGNVINEFKHISKQGYDIAYTPGDEHLYFSDGVGIVKLRKKDLKPISWRYAKDFSGRDSWTTGLKVVRDNYGEKIIVFDEVSITILDQDYKVVGAINQASDKTAACLAGDNLLLNLDSYQAAPGSPVMLNGQGFAFSEEISIYLADKKIASATTDENGRFSRLLIIPESKPGRADFRASGESSGKNYSVSFQIE